jgi:hypothetical protein
MSLIIAQLGHLFAGEFPFFLSTLSSEITRIDSFCPWLGFIELSSIILGEIANINDCQ